jgi:hypothetical protein
LKFAKSIKEITAQVQGINLKVLLKTNSCGFNIPRWQMALS